MIIDNQRAMYSAAHHHVGIPIMWGKKGTVKVIPPPQVEVSTFLLESNFFSCSLDKPQQQKMTYSFS